MNNFCLLFKMCEEQLKYAVVIVLQDLLVSIILQIVAIKQTK